MEPLDVTAVVDLSDAGSGVREFPGKLLFDHNDQAVELELLLAGLDKKLTEKALADEASDFLGGKAVSLRLADRREIRTTIKGVAGSRFNLPAEVFVYCVLGNAEFGTLVQPLQGAWSFRLTNVKLRRYDLTTQTPAPPGLPDDQRGWTLDRMTLNLGGRGWELKDELFCQAKKQREANIQVPLVTASLRTPVHAHDTPESVSRDADAIAALLTLALARSVQAVKLEHVDTGGNCDWWRTRDLVAYAFGQFGFPAVDNWESGTLRSFIEHAYPVVAADRAWWLPTLGRFMQVHVNPCLETKAMLLYMLADRIAAKFVARPTGAEIDADLDKKLRGREFREQLHALLGGLSNNWKKQRTDNLIGVIKQWNAGPSFIKGITRACQALDLKPPGAKFLGARHRLMHLGELHLPHVTPESFWTELEALILFLMLRMLKYDGLAYAAHYGCHPIRLRDSVIQCAST